jgi:hypothetical protein
MGKRLHERTSIFASVDAWALEADLLARPVSDILEW